MADSIMKEQRLEEIVLFLMEKSSIQKALYMIEGISDYILQSNLYSTLAIEFVTNFKDLKGALETIERITDYDIKNDAILELIEAAIKYGYELSINKEYESGLTLWRGAADYIINEYEHDVETIAFQFAVLIKDYCITSLQKINHNTHKTQHKIVGIILPTRLNFLGFAFFA
jgi:hypothetical protein